MSTQSELTAERIAEFQEEIAGYSEDDYPRVQVKLLRGLIGRALKAEAAAPALDREATCQARVCLKCGRTEVGWRYNRCPNCGEMAWFPR